MSAPVCLTTAVDRAALVARSGDDSLPGPWRPAAEAAGVISADAFLCHLARSIAAALEHLASSAESAHTRLQFVRQSAGLEGKSHCDDLKASIASAECSKRTVLEHQLCEVDTALERLRAVRVASAKAAATLSDSELTAAHTELAAQFDAVDALLIDLPTAVIEIPHVGLVVDETMLMSGAMGFGRVVAPRAIIASDLTLECTPFYALPGVTQNCRLVLQNMQRISQSEEELAIALSAAATALHIEVTLKAVGSVPQQLQAAVSVDAPGRCIVIAITPPDSVSVGSCVCFDSLALAGKSVLASDLLCVAVVEPPGPADISSEHAAWLHSNFPPGGTSCPGAWRELYRGTTHGFGADVFHKRCDGRARLLVLVRAKKGGWLFGGFTAVGFNPPLKSFADPAAFLFSLSNSLGRPEKLESKRTGHDLYYIHSAVICFGFGCPADLFICDDANIAHVHRQSYTTAGVAFAESASTGDHPMAEGEQRGWLAAEIVAWAV